MDSKIDKMLNLLSQKKSHSDVNLSSSLSGRSGGRLSSRSRSRSREKIKCHHTQSKKDQILYQVKNNEKDIDQAAR